jgi:hypothetical protein
MVQAETSLKIIVDPRLDAQTSPEKSGRDEASTPHT